MALPQPRLFNPSTDATLLPQIATLHASCITNDNQLLTFLPPLSHPKILASWQQWSDDIEKGTRLIIIQLAPSSEDDQEEKVAGAVALSMPVSETGSHRSEVGRLLVSPEFRFKGIARRLMGKLEEEARSRGRWLVMLDTTLGSGAEHVYPKLGYKEIGVIPNYGFRPSDGELVDEVFYYKDLRKQ